MNNIEEKWREIPGCPKYWASNLGRIKSYHIDQINGKILKGALGKDGYFKITVTINGKSFPKRRNILIALTWLGDNPDKLMVCHKNGNRQDDNISNLEYKTAKGNSLDRYLHNTICYGSKNGNTKLSEDDVKNIFISNESIDNLSKKYNIGVSTIDSIRSGKTWSDITKGLSKGSSKYKTSRYYGVSKHHNKWCVTITHMRKMYRFLGFITQEEAALYYNEKIKELKIINKKHNIICQDQ